MNKKIYDYLRDQKLRLGQIFLSRAKEVDTIIEERNFDLVYEGNHKQYHIFKVVKDKNEIVKLILDVEKGEMALSCVNQRVDKESEVLSVLLMVEFLELVNAEEKVLS